MCGTLGYVPLLLRCTEVSTWPFVGCRKPAPAKWSRKIASSAPLEKNYWKNVCLNAKTCVPVCVEDLTCCLAFHALCTTREKSAALQIGTYDDCPRDLAAWIKVVRCPGFINLLGFLKMRNKKTIFFLCGCGHSVGVSAFPVLLLLRNGTLLLRCSASTATLVFQFSKRLEGADRFLSEGMQFTLLFTQLVIHRLWHCISAELCTVQRRGEAAGHKHGFKTSLIPVSSYLGAAWSLSGTRSKCCGRDEGWHHPLPLATPQMAQAASRAPPSTDCRGGTDEWSLLQCDLHTPSIHFSLKGTWIDEVRASESGSANILKMRN